MYSRYLLLLLASMAQAQTTFEPLQPQYPNLQRQLQLTNDQWAGISQQRSDYQNYLSEKYTRLNQVNQELLFEKTRPAPDPAALGIRYYEIAAICQQSSSRFAAYKQDLRKLLTPAQATRLAQLEQQLESLPPIAEGQELNLLGAEVKTALPRSLPFSNQSPSWQVSQLYGLAPLPGCPSSRFLVGASVTGSFSPSQLYPNLTRHLALTAEQIEQIQTVGSRLEQDLSEARSAADELQRELQKESAIPNPNPSLLGERAFRLEQICRQSIALENAAEQTIPKLLTAAQQAKWAELDRALQLLPALAESQNLRLNSRVPTNALPPVYLANVLFRRIEWIPLASPNINLPGCQESIDSFRFADRITFEATKKPIFASSAESK